MSDDGFENVPVGADQIALVAPPPMLPASVTELPEQTFRGVPALAVAGGFTVITTVETAAGQGPAPSGSFVVRVNVIVPLGIDGV